MSTRIVEPVYIVIEWFGSVPYACTTEDGELKTWDSYAQARLYADEECQIGTVIEMPQEAVARM